MKSFLTSTIIKPAFTKVTLPTLSIVVPTKNEEHYLPRLLHSLQNQNLNFELIVADAGSTDHTVAIAESYGAKIVSGGHPGVGRNHGARVAHGELLLFMDADVILPRGFLRQNITEFKKRNLSLATTYVIPLTDRIDDFLIHYGMNKTYWVFQKISPIAAGFHIFVRKDLFDRIRGFDEGISLAEDHDFLCRAVKNGATFGILKSKKIKVSVRRMQREGRIVFILKMIGAFCYIKLFGPIRNDLFNYKLGDHSKDGAKL